jgi:hypothetical protein
MAFTASPVSAPAGQVIAPDEMSAKQAIRDWSWVDHMHRSIEEALSEIEREAQVRKVCYDRWVGEGKLSYVEATDRMERVLSAIKLLRDYQGIIEKSVDTEAGPF